MNYRFLQSLPKRYQSPKYLIPASIGCLCLYFVIYCTLDSNANSNKSHLDGTSSPSIRLICISDTHNGYDVLTKQLIDLYKSENDVLIHAGDMTNRGDIGELNKINEWFGTLPYKHIIAISGNMDGIGLDKGNIDGYKVFTNAVYLQHEAFEIKDIGLKLFATPFTPKFVGGFQLNSEAAAYKKWKDIPRDIHLLISHGPPQNILDSTSHGQSVGDNALWKEIHNRIKPKAVVFGHVHDSFGSVVNDGIQYVNAAMFNGIYSGDETVKPVVISLNI